MKKIISLPIILFLSTFIFAQNTYFKWAKQMVGASGISYESGWRVEVDASGYVYTTGIFTGTTDFDPGPGVYNLTSAGETDIFISKSDPFGNFIWAKCIGGIANEFTRSFVLDAGGNIYLTGSFSQTIDCDPGAGVFNITASGTSDVFIIKLSASGSFIWAKQVGGNLDANSFCITTDVFGSICLGGTFRGTADFDPGPANFPMTSVGYTDIFMMKLDAAGNFTWAKRIGGAGFFNNNSAHGLSCDLSGNIYISGIFSTTADFDPGAGVYNLTSHGKWDGFLAKFDQSGNLIWAKGIGGIGDDIAYKILPDASGNIYATGMYQGTADFDPGPGIFNLNATGDGIFVLKLDVNGNFVWAKTMGGTASNNFGICLALDNSGNVYTTGDFVGPGDFDPGPGTFIINGTGSLDIFISKLDNNGNFVWAKAMGGAGGNDQGYYISVDAYNTIYTTGHFGGTADFDPDTGVYNLTAADDWDIYIQKIGQCSGTDSVINKSACTSYTLNGQTYSSSGTYFQTISNIAGCDSIITLNLTLHSTTFVTVSPTICDGDRYFAGGTFQTTTGVYKDTLLTSDGCDSIITTNLTVLPAPNPSLGPDRKICSNTVVTVSPGNFNSYLWQDNSTQSTFPVNSAGKYWVTVKDASNCSATDTLNILSIDTVPKNFLPANQELCYGNVLRITVPNYDTYQWSTGSTSNYIDINDFGTYYLTVKDFNSCTGTDTFTIQRKNCIYIGIPNAFSPDGNSLNDVFKPTINQAVKDYHMIVFNRYGQTVFETRDYGTGWDGSFKGKPQLAGSYVYRIRYTNMFGTETIEHGSVLLMR